MPADNQRFEPLTREQFAVLRNDPDCAGPVETRAVLPPLIDARG